MRLKRIAAGVLAAVTVFTASVATSDFNNGTSLFSNAVITAEAASINYLDSSHVAVGNVIYDFNTTTKTAQVFGGYGNMKNITIPGQIDLGSKGKFDVIAIRSSAFKDNKSVYTVDLSGAYNLGHIHEDAFNGATNLTTVTLGNAVGSISARAFKDCKNLKTFNTNGNNKIVRIFSSAFENCTSLYSFTIPQSCVEIISSAFANTGLTSITIPNGVTSIGPYAFSNCKKLKTVNFQAGASNAPGLKLCGYSFLNDTALSSVSFNRMKMTTVLSAFHGCGANFKSYGAGQVDYVRDISRQLLSAWGGMSWKSYFNEAQQKQFFTMLANELTGYVKRGSFAEQAQEGCTATVLSVRMGTCGGFARAYYNLCLEAGVPADRILFAGDQHCHAWNYVKCGNKWYNIDASNGIGLCGNDAFIRAMGFDRSVTAHNPANWIAGVNEYIGSTDNGYIKSETRKFDYILNTSNSEWGIRFTGTRVS